jgi:hypothetical protein
VIFEIQKTAQERKRVQQRYGKLMKKEPHRKTANKKFLRSKSSRKPLQQTRTNGRQNFKIKR